MPNDIDLGILSDLIGAIQHFAERVAVQRQLTAIGIIVLSAWLISSLLWLLAGKRAQNWVENQQPGGGRTFSQYSISILRNIMFPILALMVLSYVQGEFQALSWQDGLLSELIWLFWLLLAYRFLIGFLYARLGKTAAHRYHRRFLSPLVVILLLGWVLNHFIPIRQLAAVEVWSGFTNPITLGALLIATVGFYFWFDGTGVLQDVARFAIRPFKITDSGALEAALIISRYVLIAIGIYVVFAILGFDSRTLAFLTAGLSVGIGFGLKEIIGNLISGVLLLIDQSLRPGDIISIEGQIGVVEHVGIRATIVSTLNNVEVVVPNQTFLTSAVTTYTRIDDSVRMLIPVEASDAYTPHEVRDVLLEVAKAHPLVVDDPQPTVFYISTGDTSRNYELAVWYNDPLKTTPLHSDLYFMIFDEFDKRGIKPATPRRDLNITGVPWIKAEERVAPAPLDAEMAAEA